MAPEPRNDTEDKQQLLWNNWTVVIEGGNVSTLNRMNMSDHFKALKIWSMVVIMSSLTLVFLFGIVGNGIVIWLLGFCLKRNPYGVYILNLAIADFTYLLTIVFQFIYVLIFIPHTPNWFANIIIMGSYFVSVTLLMAISIERCVSVLWPIWYKCHRPTHLSILYAFIWVLFTIFCLLVTVFYYVKSEIVYTVLVIDGMMTFPTFLVLFVSSLTLFIRVQCYSQQRKPSKLYWTILINVLAFLLLSMPKGIYLACYLFTGITFFNSELSHSIILLCPVNSAINPIIYFFVGRNGQQRGRKFLQKVLQNALMDKQEESEQRRGRAAPSNRA